MTTTNTINNNEEISVSGYMIYVTSLSDYSAGIHHGRWIDCLQGPNDVWEEINGLLAASPTAAQTGIPAEEWAIHDYDFNGASLAEFEDIEKLCALAKALDELDAPEAFTAFWEYEEFSDVDVALSAFNDAYQGTYNSVEDWAEEFAEGTGMLDSIPENLRCYFDFEAFARDVECSGDIFSVDVPSGNVAVFWSHY